MKHKTLEEFYGKQNNLIDGHKYHELQSPPQDVAIEEPPVNHEERSKEPTVENIDDDQGNTGIKTQQKHK